MVKICDLFYNILNNSICEIMFKNSELLEIINVFQTHKVLLSVPSSNNLTSLTV